MTNGRRGVLTTLSVGAVLAVGVIAALVAWKLYLPPPDACSRQQLLRWLFTRDLEREPADVRRALALRLESEFARAALSLEGAQSRLTDEYRRRLWPNLAALVEPWLTEKAEAYQRLPAAERTAYVEQTLDRLSAWQGLAAACPAEQPVGESPWQPLLARVRQWQAQGDAQQQALRGRFLLAVQMRWLLRAIAPALLRRS